MDRRIAIAPILALLVLELAGCESDRAAFPEQGPPVMSSGADAGVPDAEGTGSAPSGAPLGTTSPLGSATGSQGFTRIGEIDEARCGDGAVQSGEECDDGMLNSNVAANACREDCTRPTCGDGTPDPDNGEECDDGEANGDEAPATCSKTCLAGCGNGLVEDDEECDEGFQNSNAVTATCRLNCTSAGCGDGVIDNAKGETCDEGDNNSDTSASGCRSSCKLHRCGDGVVDLDEGCDEGMQNGTSGNPCGSDCVLLTCGNGALDTGEECDADAECGPKCRKPLCGDGVKGATEACDDGGANSDTQPDACRTDCSAARCGDGAVDPSLGEECDSTEGCTQQCKAAACGNGRIDGSEACDPPDGETCDPQCRSIVCGDGRVQGKEQCEPMPEGGNCSPECTNSVCGDGIIQAGEDCEPSKDANCSQACKRPKCGDGVISGSEACDDGKNDGSYGGCMADCAALAPRCGDATVQAPEICDLGTDENTGEYNTCSATCTAATGCGDATIQEELGETCDDGVNDGSYGGCTSTCIDAARCGDGQVQMNQGEICDEGESNGAPGATCNRTCDSLENSCGDGVQDGDEECDLGMSMNTGSYAGCTENCSFGPRCGDSSVQSGNGEQCDNGAMNSGGYGKCKNDCKFDARCGDGTLQSANGEQCDNGAANTGGYDKCKSDCKFDQRCGDSTIQADKGEECDDGNTNKDDGCDSCSCSTNLVFCENQCIDPQANDEHCGAQPGCGSGAAGNDCTKYGLRCQFALCGNPGWELAEGAAEGAPASINTPQIGIDDSGHLVVIWQAAADGRQEIWGNVYTPGSGWASAARIVSSTTSNRDVNLAVSGAGKAIVSWESNYDIYAAYFDGSSWTLSGEGGIIDLRDTQGDAPVSAIDGTGAAIVAWDQEGRALARNMASDGTWAAATEALSDGDHGARDVSLSMSRSGRAMTAWNEKADNYPRNIEARGYDADWLNDETVSNLDFAADEVKVVMLADTSMSALAVYDEDNVKRFKTYNGTRWTYPAVDFDTDNSVNWSTLKLASGGNSTAFALWLGNTGSLETRRFASNAWSATAALNSAGEIGDSPDIVVDASGKAYVVWEQEFQSDHRIWFRSYTTSWQPATILPASNYSKDPRIAINKNGKLAVAWDQTGTVGVAYLK